MKRRLVIIGAAGHGKVVADAALKMDKYSDIIFLDDNNELTECNGFSVMGKSSEIVHYVKDADVFVAVGDAEIRQKIQEQVHKMNAFIATVVHPQAVIGKNVTIGCGTAVMAGAVINSGSIVGEGCIINTCSSVDHDCRIADYVHIAVGAHLAGNVEVGSRTWIGAGVTVSNNVSICCNCMVGAGAVVVRRIREPGIYVGIPAGRKGMKNESNLGGGVKHNNTIPTLFEWRCAA